MIVIRQKFLILFLFLRSIFAHTPTRNYGALLLDDVNIALHTAVSLLDDNEDEWRKHVLRAMAHAEITEVLHLGCSHLKEGYIAAQKLAHLGGQPIFTRLVYMYLYETLQFVFLNV